MIGLNLEPLTIWRRDTIFVTQTAPMPVSHAYTLTICVCVARRWCCLINQLPLLLTIVTMQITPLLYIAQCMYANVNRASRKKGWGVHFYSS